MAFIFAWICCGIGASVIANAKNRSWFDWLFLGMLLGPLAIFIVGFMPTWHAPVRHKRCPSCAEYVKQEAIVCKHCGRELPMAPHKIFCPECGIDITYMPSECPKCGKKFIYRDRSKETEVI
jgi:predicted RNA-binding Zn-ribbon protein involved in translation (DUF1610 family)